MRSMFLIQHCAGLRKGSSHTRCPTLRPLPASVPLLLPSASLPTLPTPTDSPSQRHHSNPTSHLATANTWAIIQHPHHHLTLAPRVLMASLSKEHWREEVPHQVANHGDMSPLDLHCVGLNP